MATQLKLDRFAKYTWFVLAYNLVVILWGVFLRASKSGDGCGQHWLTCHGEVIPSAPELKTVIEFSHRITSALDGFIVIGLMIWAILRWKKDKGDRNRLVKNMAIGSFGFVIVEGLLGAGLVLTGNTAENLTTTRPFWMAGHLITTLILLTFLTLTAWFASGGKRLSFKRAEPKVLLVLGLFVLGFLLIGITGSIAALSNMVFPSETISEGIAKDFSPSSHTILRLRVSHPIVSILTSVFIFMAAGWFRSKFSENPNIVKWSGVLGILVIVQIAFGSLTLFMLAPIVMQLGHLLLADLIWIAFILMSAHILSAEDLR